jgi:NADPH:quinone reductase-like Zn-dependent oxidoreductase
MKAIFFEQHGGPEVLKFGDLSEPTAKPGMAIVKVTAVALNHLDIWVRRGWHGLSLQMPHIGGSDIVGEVVSAGGGEWHAGAKVIVNPGFNLGVDEWTRRGEDSVSSGYRIIGEHVPGGLAEFVAVPVANVFKKPEELSDENACAGLLVGTTVWRMLFSRAQLRAGETVLVVGAGGGVNSLAIQFAKAAGATVFVLGGGKEKLTKARGLGADEVIDYNKHDNWPAEVLRVTRGLGVDVVVDNVGTPTLPKSIRAAARGGRIVTVGNTKGHDIEIDNRLIFTKQLSLIGSTMGSAQDFIDAQAFILANRIKVAVDRVEPLFKGIDMLQLLEQGSQFGKIVLKP